MSSELPIEQGGEALNSEPIIQENKLEKESFPEGLAKSGIIILGTFGIMYVGTAIESGNDEEYFEKNLEQTPEVIEIQEIEHQQYVQDGFVGISLLGLSLLSAVALVGIRRKNRDKK